jgi:hypothetical protein
MSRIAGFDPGLAETGGSGGKPRFRAPARQSRQHVPMLTAFCSDRPERKFRRCRLATFI